MPRIKTRTESHLLLLTPEEKQKWRELAFSVGMNLNEYIRRCVERRRIPIPKHELGNILSLVARIALNLNKLALVLNNEGPWTKDKTNEEAIKNLVSDTRKILKALRTELLGIARTDSQNGSIPFL